MTELKKQAKSERNSVLEILRLCASLWVMYYHGLSLFARTEAFRNGRIAVDFFFLLSGFFFIVTYQKEENQAFFKGLGSFIWKRFKPLMWTFIICMVFSIIHYIQFYEGFLQTSIWGYLWYIPHLMIVFSCYYTLRRLIKRKIAFNITTMLAVLISTILILTGVTDYGVVRGIAGVGYGILISQIPTIWKYKAGKIISVSLTIFSFSIITILAIIHPAVIIQDCLCLIILFPAIIYFAGQIPFSNKVINAICSISFGLYAYQTVTRVFESNEIITSHLYMFLIVLALAIIDRLVIYLVKKKSIPNKAQHQ